MCPPLFLRVSQFIGSFCQTGNLKNHRKNLLGNFRTMPQSFCVTLVGGPRMERWFSIRMMILGMIATHEMGGCGQGAVTLTGGLTIVHLSRGRDVFIYRIRGCKSTNSFRSAWKSSVSNYICTAGITCKTWQPKAPDDNILFRCCTVIVEEGANELYGQFAQTHITCDFDSNCTWNCLGDQIYIV